MKREEIKTVRKPTDIYEEMESKVLKFIDRTGANYNDITCILPMSDYYILKSFPYIIEKMSTGEEYVRGYRIIVALVKEICVGNIDFE